MREITDILQKIGNKIKDFIERILYIFSSKKCKYYKKRIHFVLQPGESCPGILSKNRYNGYLQKECMKCNYFTEVYDGK